MSKRIDFPLDGRHAFIGGEWVVLEGADRIEATSPSDERLLGYIAAGKAEHVDMAVERIKPALAEWQAMSVSRRSKYLIKYGKVLEAHADHLTELDVQDGGMTVTKSGEDVKRSIKWCIDYIGYAMELKGRTYASAANTLSYTTRDPYGIVGQIAPFNHPQNFGAKAILPAVIAGNAVLVKPPEQASLSTLALAQLAKDVFPPGIVNVITGHGREVGHAIAAHPGIPRIGFVGSVPTGARIMAAGAPNIKHVTLELGGKNPLIITDGIDVDFAAKTILRNMNLSHCGQSCQSSTRMLVHTSIYAKVVDRLAELMKGVKVGDPASPETNMGPIAFKEHYARVLDYIRIGQEEGAVLRFGGKRPEGMDKGYFLLPTMFANVKPSMRIAREEIFGPVCCLIEWEDEAEAIAIADDTDMGLNCRIFAPTMERGIRIGKQLQTGTCYVNTRNALDLGMPVGGFRHSGIGKQNCLEEVESYTRERSWSIGIG